MKICAFLLTFVMLISVTGCFGGPVTEIADESDSLSIPMEESKREKVTLNVWHGNGSALAFYEKMGLRPRNTMMELPLEDLGC